MKKLALLLVTIGLGALALYTFQSRLNPYTTFAQAQAGQVVQVYGTLGDEGFAYTTAGELTFSVTDETGTTVPVVYNGPAPANMDHAQDIVVIGTLADGVFTAHRLLVKCPSKYEVEGDVDNAG